MAAFYRKHLFTKIVHYVKCASPLDLSVNQLVRLVDANKKYGNEKAQLKILLATLGPQACGAQLQSDLQTDIGGTDVEAVTGDRNYLYVKIKTHKFNQHVLNTVQKQKQLYGYKDEDDASQSPQNILVEYSSPNIAKPFHAGHLRSTLLGNYISNLYEALGHKVTRLNFLGDWGTQFGLLLTGYHRYGDSQRLTTDPLLHLFEVYVKVNQDVTREQKEGQRSTYDEALQTFTRLENGDPSVVRLWKDFCNISMSEYNTIYQRLGVKFSDIHTESMYHQSARTLIDELKQDRIMHTDENGVGFIELSQPDGEAQKVKLMKSDGSTLYLTRDIAAIIDRYNNYKFDKIHYVVDLSQTGHFQHLQGVLDALGHTWTRQSHPHFHVAFGQVEGMSTRRGEVVFLRDILDEARNRMVQTLQQKDTTRAGLDINEVAEVLGISSVIIQDLKARRRNNYTFSWDRMLNFKSDSGVFLQYCHARLCSLLRSFSDQNVECMDGHDLTEDVTCRLILHIASYPDAVQESVQTLEPCVIVNYLFQLCHLVNAAYTQLPVKNQSDDIAQARLSLFDSSRQTLVNGLLLLGITPLEKM